MDGPRIMFDQNLNVVACGVLLFIRDILSGKYLTERV
jgi:hypothetical protein